MCHQTVSLVARYLEAHGIPTVCLGSAEDILRAGQPPRAVFVDYPLGHSAGKPFDAADQRAILKATLAVLERAKKPGEMVTLPMRWPNSTWAETAMRADGGDTRQPRDDSPQWQFPEDALAAKLSGAWRDPTAT